MKYFPLLLFIIVTACNQEPTITTITENQQKEFEEVARTYQEKYMEGNENCEFLIKFMDENIRMSEARFGEPNMEISYEQLVQFCPHLPRKEVISTITEQRLLQPDLGYDYVSQLYLRPSVGDTARETSARIWSKKEGSWKIIQMNNSLNVAADH